MAWRKGRAGWPIMAAAVIDSRRRSGGVSVCIHGLDGPTPERLQHGPVLTAIASQGPRAGHRRGARAMDPLSWLYVRDWIGQPQLQAGLEFRRAFTVARLEAVQAVPLQPRVDGGGRRCLVDAVEDARAAVRADVAAVGGFRSPAAGLLWHVVGEGDSVTAWARMHREANGRAPRHATTRSILTEALGAIAERRGLTGGTR